MTVEITKDTLKNIPRERWATVLGMVFVQKMPQAALEQIALGGRRQFVKLGLKTDLVGLKSEDYGDIYQYIVLAVQTHNQMRAEIAVARQRESQDD